MRFASIDDLRAACRNVRQGDEAIALAARKRQSELTKPLGSLGRLEDAAIWLSRWQRRPVPRLERIVIVVFAGNHGITSLGVSAYPSSVTEQMVLNYARGGAAINQLAKLAGAELSVLPISLGRPTEDFSQRAAMDEKDFLAAVQAGYDAVPACDLLAVGEMGIGNTTAAAAICAGLLGGEAEQWVGRGTGIDDLGLSRKREAVRAGLKLHEHLSGDPLRLAAALGGRELAAILGATLAAHHQSIPTVIDGFVASAAVLPLAKTDAGLLAHCIAGHVSAEAAHARLLQAISLDPLLDLRMRLGEASGAAVAILLLKAAVACHAGMATFDEARVSGPIR